MASSSRRTKGLQQGPRSRRVVEGVHAATLQELARVGYAGLTMDGVATAAGVHRTTLYRRWPTKAALVASVLEPGLERLQIAERGTTLAADLTLLGLRLAEEMVAPHGRALVAAFSGGDPELGTLAAEGRTRALAVLLEAFERAADRGERALDGSERVRAHLLMSGVVQATLDGQTRLNRDEVAAMVRVLLP